MKFIPKSVSAKLTRQALVAFQHSPKVLFGLGIVGVTASTVMACRGTLRLEEVLKETQTNLETNDALRDHPNYSEKEYKQDRVLIYTKGIVAVGKLYAPAVGLGLVSVGALTASNRILTQRLIGVTAAYSAVDEAFNRYRGRVVEKFGKDVDREMRYEAETVKIIDGENGRTVSKLRVAPDADSQYARWFDSKSDNWEPEAEFNYMFLTSQQNYFNDRLSVRGHVFLNEVYDALGLPHTTAGSVVGWVSGGEGDNYIDFGITNETRDGILDFLNGTENSVLLDFNVDGVIYDKINPRKRGDRR